MPYTRDRISWRHAFVGLAAFALIGQSCQPQAAQGDAGMPALPRVYVNTTYVVPGGKLLSVSADGDFQAALDKAQPGDTITLVAGATYTGPFVLPFKQGSGWIVIRSNDMTNLPPAGTRVTPAAATDMPKLVSSSGPVISAAPRAHHFRFIGLEIEPGPAYLPLTERMLSWLGSEPAATAPAAKLENLVSLGADSTDLSSLPHHIIFDRCYIHGDETVGTRRGLALNARYAAVIDSYLSGFSDLTADAQAIDVWNASGPFKIVNNYIEASGENLMFGGEDPSIKGLVPADIEIRGNYFSKPLGWKTDDPGYQGTPWIIKNLFELKNAERVLVTGNVFEHNWPQAQNGFSILFTVRNQEGGAPWSVVRDVTFRGNILRHAASGINILGYDNNYPSRQTQRILIEDNLFYDLGGTWGDGTLLQLLDGVRDVIVRHNTALQTGSIVYADGRRSPGFVFIDNIAAENQYGVIGTGTGTGIPTLQHYFPDTLFTGNVIVGGSAIDYPAGNYFPASTDTVGFVNPATFDFRLDTSSPYKNQATDGTDIGADANSLCNAFSATQQPVPAYCSR
jgi:hypothetical protein